MFGFSQSEYSTSEERREVMITVELQEGVLESDVQILLLSSDGTARSEHNNGAVSSPLARSREFICKMTSFILKNGCTFSLFSVSRKTGV